MWHLYGTHMVGFWYLEVVSRKPVSGYLASKVAPAWGFAAAGLPRTHIILLSGHPVQHPWNGMNGYIFLQFALLSTCQWILYYVTSIERAKDRRPVLTVMGLVIRGMEERKTVTTGVRFMLMSCSRRPRTKWRNPRTSVYEQKGLRTRI